MNDIFNENVPLKTETPAFAKHVLGAVPSVVYNEDCVEGLKRFSDNHFDLAIVDPPYGLNISALSNYGESGGTDKRGTPIRKTFISRKNGIKTFLLLNTLSN
jgi:DNA modification methylase